MLAALLTVARELLRTRTYPQRVTCGISVIYQVHTTAHLLPDHPGEGGIMPREAITSQGAPKPSGAYSPIVRAGSFLYVSGQAAIDPETGEVVGSTTAEQADRTMRNIELQLRGAGASLDDVVKTTVYLGDIGDFDEFNRVYASFFPTGAPARTTIGAGLEGIRVEIDVVAYIGQE
jgi:2-iminobutanoate/2-iminopropanoate deaminase